MAYFRSIFRILLGIDKLSETLPPVWAKRFPEIRKHKVTKESIKFFIVSYLNKVYVLSCLVRAHVEVALEGIIHVNYFLEMRPTQLSPQCRDNLEIGENFGKTHTMTKLFFTPSLPEIKNQVLTQ